MGTSNDTGLSFRDKTLGRYLKNKRELRGFTQSQVAEKLGYSSSQFISNIERGISNVPIKSLRILIELYQLQGQEVIDILLEERRNTLRDQLGIQKVEMPPETPSPASEPMSLL